MKIKNKYKFLSKSVLLEESGLPKFYGVTIFIITIFIIGFLLWSNQVKINDTVSANGYAIKVTESSNRHDFIAKISSKNIGQIRVGNKVMISIPGIRDRERVIGKVIIIDHKPEIDSNGRVLYKISLEPELDQVTRDKLELLLLDTMETKIEIVTGNRTLLQYILGPLWDASKA